jgi:hypothetical protein
LEQVDHLIYGAVLPSLPMEAEFLVFSGLKAFPKPFI